MATKSEVQSPTVNQPSSSMAVISLIAGILGLTLFPFIGSIVAVLTGISARREIRQSAGGLSGEGMATVGLVLGWAGLALTLLGLLIAGAVIGLSLCMMLFAAGNLEFSWLVPFVAIMV